MKIKGIRKDSNAVGELIELSAEEKVPLTLQDALSRHEKFEGKYLVWSTDVKLDRVSFFPKGGQLKKSWQNNHYQASGVFTLNQRKLDPDRLMGPKKTKFFIEFEDCIDPIGQPDTKVLKLTLE